MTKPRNFWQTAEANSALIELKTKYPEIANKIPDIPGIASLKASQREHFKCEKYEEEHETKIDDKWSAYLVKRKKQNDNARNAASRARAYLKAKYPEVYTDVFGG